jgi:hypothetical protein
MFTENSPRLRIAIPVALPSFVQNKSMHGVSDTDVSELMVAPNSLPVHSVAMMATPVGKAPITERKCFGSMVCMFMSPPLLKVPSEQP